ncbi:hypothetical protein SAMN04489860_0498 [Paraoerskovia marina]|uniref:LPXTG-motif cell wall anchor domain-containing protein n=1 Tax=Paraoerskovia marina TaxID=545619 RepID=A0A1H1ND35_9CELL|nr:peptidase [Paraoerskovia marina]SDR96817.1 hypothetical protein SAMN04489860_0498 [Paraoerskovia marina]
MYKTGAGAAGTSAGTLAATGATSLAVVLAVVLLAVGALLVYRSSRLARRQR